MTKLPVICSYADFAAALQACGLTMGGENDEGVFSLCACFAPEIRWHTGNPETDPWEWRMRVLEEGGNAAYAKLFFKKSGYVARPWYPALFALRRGSKNPEALLGENPVARRIYTLVRDNTSLPLHLIKQLGAFAPEERKVFDRELTRLQGQMLLTMCGRAQKQSQTGESYGWSSTCFTTPEHFFPEEARQGAALDPKEALDSLTSHLLTLNPAADRKKINKFLVG